MLSFTERMQLGRDIAQVNRNRGRHVGACAPGWNYKQTHPESGTWEALCYVSKMQWQSVKSEALNRFRSVCLNPINDQPDTWEI